MVLGPFLQLWSEQRTKILAFLLWLWLKYQTNVRYSKGRNSDWEMSWHISYLWVWHQIVRSDEPDSGSLEKGLSRVFTIHNLAKFPERVKIQGHLNQILFANILFYVGRPIFEWRQDVSFFINFFFVGRCRYLGLTVFRWTGSIGFVTVLFGRLARCAFILL